jgi:hypothetical protein
MLARRGPRRVALAIALIGVGLVFAGPVIAVTSPDPITAARYSIVIDGTEIATFNSLIDLTRSLSGEPSVELEGPYTTNNAVESWLEQAQSDPTTGRKNFDLIAFSTEGTPVARYKFTKGSPATIHIQGTKAGASDVLSILVKFTAKRVTRVPV